MRRRGPSHTPLFCVLLRILRFNTAALRAAEAGASHTGRPAQTPYGISTVSTTWMTPLDW
jgi:hypothetical protein